MEAPAPEADRRAHARRAGATSPLRRDRPLGWGRDQAAKAGGGAPRAGARMLAMRVSWGRIFRRAVSLVLLDNTFGS